ncbi:dTDP-4-dehydrorhamnose reductase [Paenibacillus sp. V4I3]|uniref:dTDP-4-dehydrorhamnose reductase family protein n=1 Tax=Paenibacillus sp. V4I3 TaxID=3042305 RepID=UPI002780BF9A|nr:SDR family oxidoreductase [Paenibacillus sp. V4I3]MDQ0878109.1 dTDP-4-dehydrorhamnose reductase [Paenibacillus sp. V4I3]
MRILVIGGNGMAGHMLLQYLTKRTDYEVFYTVRSTSASVCEVVKAGRATQLYLDTLDVPAVKETIRLVKPDVIVNCVGILNDFAREHALEAYQINGKLPHELAKTVEAYGGRLVHISSDCVYSGNRGNYEEHHIPDGTSVYAKTKALGEVKAYPHITVRTSIIGPEIRKDGIGLMHWFFRQQGAVKGFTKVPWNGVTTLELVKFIHHAIERGPELHGLVHLTAAETVSKCELLQLFQQVFGKKDVVIEPDDAIVLDRTLICTRNDLGYQAPGYEAMLGELRDWMCAVP